MISSINVMDHISVTVSDMERSLAFYRDLLGMEQIETHRLEGETISNMVGKDDVVMQVVRLQAPESPGMLLDLQEYVQPQGKISNGKLGDVGHSHICFGVPDMAQAYQELKADGGNFRVGAGQLRSRLGHRPRGLL